MTPRVSPVDVTLLERLFDRSPDVAFFVKDAGGRYVAVNESLVARHGLKSKSQVIGKCPRDICLGDFGRIPTEQDEKVLRSGRPDRKSTRLNSSHVEISYAVFCLKKKKNQILIPKKPTHIHTT